MWIAVFLVGSCLARGEAWAEQRYGAFQSFDECSEALAAARMNSPDVSAFCVRSEGLPVSVPACPPTPTCPTCSTCAPGSPDYDGDGEVLPYDLEAFTKAFNAAYTAGR